MSHNWKEIQRRLLELGFNPGPIDGLRGPRTDAAIVEFKKSVGLRARPYFGPLTKLALYGAALAHKVTGGNPEPVDPKLGYMVEAERVRGLHEQRDVSTLRKWFDKSVSWIDPREIPWCGAFVATCLRQWRPDTPLPENPLGARNWKAFGQQSEPGYGAILVFWRGSIKGWKGHVGFYWGEDSTHYHVLGGNQSNAVTITRIKKSRLLGARMPSGLNVQPKRINLRPDGVPITTNEA